MRSFGAVGAKKGLNDTYYSIQSDEKNGSSWFWNEVVEKTGNIGHFTTTTKSINWASYGPKTTVIISIIIESLSGNSVFLGS